ncbi:MAG: PepSY-like domain-containing protein [Bacteroidetes bacterium]|nr:PepSY-like domain-containing protein [Bacteroidota bacterium]
MKNLILFVFVVLLCITACGQISAPSAVQKAFDTKYPKAENIKWEQEEANDWEAEFKLDGKEMSAIFDNSGKWLETETEVKKKDLPAEVFKSLSIEFDGFEIDEVEFVEKPDFKGYEIALEKEETEVEVLVTKTGEITIKKVNAEDEDEDDENEDEDDEDDDDEGNDDEDDDDDD